jgi:toxin ParE1/3/4
MPEIGRMRNELVPGIRSLPIKRYVIFYMVREKNIEIARVLSGYRDLASVF